MPAREPKAKWIPNECNPLTLQSSCIESDSNVRMAHPCSRVGSKEKDNGPGAPCTQLANAGPHARRQIRWPTQREGAAMKSGRAACSWQCWRAPAHTGRRLAATRPARHGRDTIALVVRGVAARRWEVAPAATFPCTHLFTRDQLAKGEPAATGAVSASIDPNQ